jgi:hypothetical protein
MSLGKGCVHIAAVKEVVTTIVALLIANQGLSREQEIMLKHWRLQLKHMVYRPISLCPRSARLQR